MLIFSGTIAGHSAAGAVILVAALITGSVVAQTRPPDQPEIRQLVAEAVDAASADLGILVDPTVSEEIAKTVMVFASNFCYPPDLGPSVARCERTVRRSSVLTSEVRSYLKSALDERPSALRSVGAALAEREGMFFEHIGWSSELPNRVAVVQLPRTPSGTVSLRTASGPLRLGSNRQHLLVAPGTLEIEVVEGSSKSIAMVQAQAGRVVVAALDGQRDGGSGPPLRIDPPVALYCGGLEARSSDALRFFNWGRVTISEPDSIKRSNLAPIARQPFVEILVRDVVGACDEQCMAGLGTTFVQAIALWRGGCNRCDQNAMSVVKVGRHVWIDTRLASRIRSGASTLDLNSTNPSETALAVTAPSITVPTSAMYGYESVVARGDLERRICAASALNPAPWLSDAKEAVCEGRSSSRGVRPTLSLRGRTSCGPASDFIACGRPGEEVELAMDSTKYGILTVGGPTYLGSSNDGAIDLRDVVIHEVGHWFGVPHIDEAAPGSAGDIMSATYGDGKACLSGASLMMLNNAMDLRWPHRVIEGKGLRRPQARSSPSSQAPVLIPQTVVPLGVRAR